MNHIMNCFPDISYICTCLNILDCIILDFVLHNLGQENKCSTFNKQQSCVSSFALTSFKFYILQFQKYKQQDFHRDFERKADDMLQPTLFTYQNLLYIQFELFE